MSSPRFHVTRWCCDFGSCARCFWRPEGSRVRIYVHGDFNESDATFLVRAIPRTRYPLKEIIR